jgi:hypothetical protein
VGYFFFDEGLGFEVDGAGYFGIVIQGHGFISQFAGFGVWFDGKFAHNEFFEGFAILHVGHCKPEQITFVGFEVGYLEIERRGCTFCPKFATGENRLHD